MCEPGILRLCCIVQYVSWCPYFMHCELNHVGPVTSDATTCFSVKCGCARLQHHAPPLLPSLPLLPSSLWGSGGWRGRGSRCAQYKSGSCISCKRHHCHTSRRLCALLYQPLCFTVCSAVPCPQTASLQQHCSIPKDSQCPVQSVCMSAYVCA